MLQVNETWEVFKRRCVPCSHGRCTRRMDPVGDRYHPSCDKEADCPRLSSKGHLPADTAALKEAYEAGYISGHDDTVESQYGDPTELAKEYVAALSSGAGQRDVVGELRKLLRDLLGKIEHWIRHLDASKNKYTIQVMGGWVRMIQTSLTDSQEGATDGNPRRA